MTSESLIAPTAAAPSPVPADDSPCWTFYEEVAAAQLAAWMPAAAQRVLDLSGGRARFAAQLVEAGHEVVHARPADRAGLPLTEPAVGAGAPGRLLPVVVDARSLSWLADRSVDAVLAESRALALPGDREHR